MKGVEWRDVKGVEGRDVKGVSIPTPVNVQQKNTSLGPRFSFQMCLTALEQ